MSAYVKSRKRQKEQNTLALFRSFSLVVYSVTKGMSKFEESLKSIKGFRSLTLHHDKMSYKDTKVDRSGVLNFSAGSPPYNPKNLGGIIAAFNVLKTDFSSHQKIKSLDDLKGFVHESIEGFSANILFEQPEIPRGTKVSIWNASNDSGTVLLYDQVITVQFDGLEVSKKLLEAEAEHQKQLFGDATISSVASKVSNIIEMCAMENARGIAKMVAGKLGLEIEPVPSHFNFINVFVKSGSAVRFFMRCTPPQIKTGFVMNSPTCNSYYGCSTPVQFSSHKIFASPSNTIKALPESRKRFLAMYTNIPDLVSFEFEEQKPSDGTTLRPLAHYVRN